MNFAFRPVSADRARGNVAGRAKLAFIKRYPNSRHWGSLTIFSFIMLTGQKRFAFAAV
jgi:hypothetical protein